MISVDGLAVEFGGTTLFSDISFVINEKDRIEFSYQLPSDILTGNTGNILYASTKLYP